MKQWKLGPRLWILFLLSNALTAGAQQSAAPSNAVSASVPPAATGSTASTAPPTATFKASSRMVAVEVVARDHKGQPIAGLTADDFQVSEQIAGKREQHPQKIAAFRAVSVAEIAAQDKGKLMAAPHQESDALASLEERIHKAV